VSAMNLSAVKNVGRPRDETRDAVILTATLEVLADVGYDRLTIDAVATKAKASKATVYRRWPDKNALVVEAIQTLHQPVGEEPVCLWPDTGSLRGDLMAAVRHFMDRLNSDEGRLTMAVMTAQARDPELARVIKQATYDDKRRSCRMLADRAIARGELNDASGVDTFVEVLPAIMFNRLLISEPFDEAFLNHVVDDIALPLLGKRA
jgi:AcrR family transcriptional regulator